MTTTPPPPPPSSSEENSKGEQLELLQVDEHNVPFEQIPEQDETAIWHRVAYAVFLLVDEKPKHDDEENKTTASVWVPLSSCTKSTTLTIPLVGGWVHRGESSEECVTRHWPVELKEGGVSSSLERKRLFTFPMGECHSWGEVYQVTLPPTMATTTLDGKLLSLAEVQRQSIDSPKTNNNEKDVATRLLHHAWKLYSQHALDHGLERRFWRGYSTGDLNRYRLRPAPQVIFFDCDDCLYFDSWKVANLLTQRIDDWFVRRGFSRNYAYELYKEHGTSLKGLIAKGHLDPTESAIDEYLREVHDLPISSLLSRDDRLRRMLLQIDPSISKFVFTASVRHHAQRCLEALGIDDLFVDIIDTKACGIQTKHSPQAFETAMTIAAAWQQDGVDLQPEACILLDDSLRNLETAHKMQWRSILVGRTGRDCQRTITSPHAEHEIDFIHELPHVLPEIFRTDTDE